MTVLPGHPSWEPNEDMSVGERLHAIVTETFWEDGDDEAWSACVRADQVVIRDVPSRWTFDHAVAEFHITIDAMPGMQEAVWDRIVERTREIGARLDLNLIDVLKQRTIPSLGRDWREVQSKRLKLAAGTVTNQAGGEVRDRFPREDGMTFRSTAELKMYRLLKQLQDDMKFSMYPLPKGRLPNGDVREPDFLVVINGRAGVIEVDGKTGHDGRRANDATRDRLFRPSVWSIERVPVEDLDDPDGLKMILRQWLQRLASE